MKNHFLSITLILCIGLGIVSCAKEDSLSNDGVNTLPIPHATTSISLEDAIDNYVNYMVDQNNAHSGNLFNYLEDANYSYSGLLLTGYVDQTTLEGFIDDLEIAIANASYAGASEESISNAMETAFDDSEVPIATRIILFRCVGCLDDVEKNHCITLFHFFKFGPGCP